LGAFARARVGVSPLSANRKPTTVPESAVAAEIHQPLDAHLHFATQVTLDLVVLLDDATDRAHLLVGQIVGTNRRTDARLLQDLLRGHPANPINIGQCNLDTLVAGEVDP